MPSIRPAYGLAVALIVAALVPAGAVTQTPSAPWPTTAWTPATPESVGANGAALAAIDADIRKDIYGLVDRLFVVYRGRAIANHRYARDYREISKGRTGPIGCGYGCTDPSWMHQFNYFHPDWHPYYQGRDVHSLQSVTKSVAATVIGIALGRSEITGLDRPFLAFFKDRDLSKVDPRLHRATVEDVLTMRSGIEWHEQDRPLDRTNTTVQLENSRDWIAFTLAQPMDADPGTKWVYNSGGSMLLSGIIRAATGRFIDEYAAEHLFRPLGIREFHWKRTPTGHPDTEGGLYLSAEDLGKIGYLYLRGGMWDGRRILPAGFVERATTRHVPKVAAQFDYGYQWWLTRRGDADVWAGRGFGGQLLIVIPSRDIVAVVNAWNVFGTPARGIMGPLLDALMAVAPKNADYASGPLDPWTLAARAATRRSTNGRVRSRYASLPIHLAAGADEAFRSRASFTDAACSFGLRLPIARSAQLTPFLTKFRSSLAARLTSGNIFVKAESGAPLS